jgi:hypothetical protein
MDGTIRKILNAVVLIVLALWRSSAFGAWGSYQESVSDNLPDLIETT